MDTSQVKELSDSNADSTGISTFVFVQGFPLGCPNIDINIWKQIQIVSCI